MTTYTNIFNAITDALLLKALKARTAQKRTAPQSDADTKGDAFWAYTEANGDAGTSSFNGIL